MANIRESAKAFEPKTTKNVADLEKLDVELSVEDRQGTNEEGKTFDYKVVIKDGEEYRIPSSVLSQIKTILEARPAQKFVKVVKKGTGMNTVYTVIQMD